ncbi:fimbrial protein [Pseudomonas sp. 1912-s]|uniref:fimbrial protein n=1 Tax=Pseudomonas sp. 1912-s TaxID=3033802 RepID=UPI0023E025D5|nr:fimbrial protein [Pseudomonas sp. 1912-s]MDF3199162.1 fimbrial protein [Pseudomonas sp. 1912-s]
MSMLSRICILLFFFQASTSAYADCSTGDREVYQTFDMGIQYVPRDAPIGSIIGTANIKYVYNTNTSYTCGWSDEWEIRVSSNFTVVPNITLPQMEGGISKATVLKTNVPGVGLIVSSEPLQSYSAISGSPPYVPYKVRLAAFPGVYKSVPAKFTLVKISNDIPVGSSRIESPNSTISYWSTNRLHSIFLKGTVIRSECSVTGGGHAYIEVPMGAVSRREFKGKDSYSKSNGFVIPLTNCTPGSYPSNQSWNYYNNSNAHIRLDGLQGSTLIDATRGVIGLSQESTAKGVAVQILRKDGVTPLSLGKDVSIDQLKGNSMDIELKARYIQTSNITEGPEPGSANARAAFTITYK